MSTDDLRLAIIWISPDGAWIYHRSENGFLPEDRASARVERSIGMIDSPLFFAAVCKKLKPFHKVVILGPDITTFHFRTYLQEQAPDLYRKILGFELVGTISPAQGTAYIQKYEAI